MAVQLFLDPNIASFLQSCRKQQTFFESKATKGFHQE